MTEAPTPQQMAERKYDLIALWFDENTIEVDEYLGEHAALVVTDYLEWCHAHLIAPGDPMVAGPQEMAVFLLASGYPIAMSAAVENKAGRAAALLATVILAGIYDEDDENEDAFDFGELLGSDGNRPEVFLMGRALRRQWPRRSDYVDGRIIADSADADRALAALAAFPPRPGGILVKGMTDAAPLPYGARVVELSEDAGYVHVNTVPLEGAESRDFVISYLLLDDDEIEAGVEQQ